MLTIGISLIDLLMNNIFPNVKNKRRDGVFFLLGQVEIKLVEFCLCVFACPIFIILMS
jgi:hypothetical protein